jgi:hypothetical protein
MTTPEEIIPDAEIARVHANANFGTMGKRKVVNLAALKAAIGYHNGSTAQAIIIEHGLFKAPKKPDGHPIITDKGRQYLYACFGDSF